MRAVVGPTRQVCRAYGRDFDARNGERGAMPSEGERRQRPSRKAMAEVAQVTPEMEGAASDGAGARVEYEMSSYSELARGVREAQAKGVDAGRMADEHREELREAIAAFDRDASGGLDRRELKLVMRALGFDLENEQIEEFVADAMRDEAGDVSLQSFTELVCDKVRKRHQVSYVARV